MFQKFISTALLIAWTSGGQATPAPRFDDIPQVEDGRALYVTGVDIDVTGTLTNPTGGNITPGTAAQINLIRRVTIQPTGVPRAIVDAKGINLARLYRLEHEGKRPAQWASTGVIASGGGTASVSFTLPIEFGIAGALRPEDFAIPVPLFGNSAMQVFYGTGDDVSTGLTVSSTTITVTPRIISLPTVECPTFAVVDEIEQAAGTTQPQIPVVDGILQVFATARRSGVFATSEQTIAALNVGSQIVSDLNTKAKVFYRAFNDNVSVTDLQDHTAAAAALDDSFPLVRPDLRVGSNKITRGIILSGNKQVLKLDVATNTYDIIRRWLPGPAEQQTYASLVAVSQGYAPNFYESGNAKTVTNSHKATGSAFLAAMLPAKAMTQG